MLEGKPTLPEILTNHWTSPVRISLIQVLGLNALEFGFPTFSLAGCSGTELAPEASCRFEVYFSPPSGAKAEDGSA